jgi:small subunit ribosomal protein S10
MEPWRLLRLLPRSLPRNIFIRAVISSRSVPSPARIQYKVFSSDVNAVADLEVKERKKIDISDADDRLYNHINVKIKGFDYAVLDSYAQFMSKAAQLLGIDMSGKVCLPTQIQKFTVLKSPFVYKKHRVQYELRTHVRLLQIRKVTGTTADIFLEYIQRNIPEGVNMSVYQESAEKPPQVLAQLLKDAKKKAKEAKLKN